MIFTIPLRRILFYELAQLSKTWQKNLLPFFVFLMTHYIVFSQLGLHHNQDYHGFLFIVFVTPGLLIIALSRCAHSQAFRFGRKEREHFLPLLVSPTPFWVFTTAHALSAAIQSLIMTAVGMSIGFYFFLGAPKHALEVVIAFSAIALLFSNLGILQGLLSKKSDSPLSSPNLIMLPAAYLGGTFYLPSSFPIWVQYLIYINPFFYCSEIARSSLIEHTSIPLYQSWIVVISCIIISFILIELTLRRKSYFRA